MRPSYPVLIVSRDSSLVPLADGWLAGAPATVATSVADAIEVIESRALAGLILFVGTSSPLPYARDLVTEYVRRQPMGNVALFSDGTDATITTLLASPHARVEVFFRPWDGAELRAFLKLTELPAAGRLIVG